MLAILLLSLGQFGLDGPIYSNATAAASRGSQRALADFEFAPPEGYGMGAACACATPTGARGETLTFTRASSGTCLKASATTGIVAGDMATCSTDEPRVMFDNGGGSLGLLVEAASTNLHLRSQEFDNASWLKSVGVTVTANSASCPLAPDGTQTMDLVTYAGLSDTGIYQAVTVTLNSTVTHSVFVARKTGGAACVLALTDAYTATPDTVVTAAADGTITRFSNTTAITGTVASVYLREATAGDCTDVCVWGGQIENAAVVTSYIATAGTAVTRARDIAFATLSAPIDQGDGIYSAAMTVTVSGASTTNWQAFFLQNAGATLFHSMYNAGVSTLRCDSYDGATELIATHAKQGAFTAKRIVCFNDGTAEQGIYDGTPFTTPAAGVAIASTAVTKVYLGCDPSAGFELNGVIKEVCFDRLSGRCR